LCGTGTLSVVECCRDLPKVGFGLSQISNDPEVGFDLIGDLPTIVEVQLGFPPTMGSTTVLRSIGV